MHLEEIKKLESLITEKANAYHYIGKQDRHLIKLFHWSDILENLADEVRESDQDHELEKELRNISLKIIKEIGIRISCIFP